MHVHFLSSLSKESSSRIIQFRKFWLPWLLHWVCFLFDAGPPIPVWNIAQLWNLMSSDWKINQFYAKKEWDPGRQVSLFHLLMWTSITGWQFMVVFLPCLTLVCFCLSGFSQSFSVKFILLFRPMFCAVY